MHPYERRALHFNTSAHIYRKSTVMTGFPFEKDTAEIKLIAIKERIERIIAGMITFPFNKPLSAGSGIPFGWIPRIGDITRTDQLHGLSHHNEPDAGTIPKTKAAIIFTRMTAVNPNCLAIHKHNGISQSVVSHKGSLLQRLSAAAQQFPEIQGQVKT